MMRTSRVFALCSILIPTAAWAAAAPPVAVSPGSVTGMALVGERCPTFLWGGEEGARAYELVVYRLGEEGVTETAVAALRVTLPGNAHGWKPSLEQCLEPGSRYAWSLRSLGRRGGSRWSDPALFEIADPSSLFEVERAVEVLQRYLDELGPGVAGAPMTAEPGRRSNAAPSGPRGGANRALGSGLDRTPQPAGKEVGGEKALEERWEQRLRERMERVSRGVLDSRPSAGPSAALEGPLEAASSPTLGIASLTVDEQVHLGPDSQVFKDGLLFLWDDGDSNIALGREALKSNTSGTHNTGIGKGALYYNAAGEHNTAVGSQALWSNTSGVNNVAVGSDALASLEDQPNNTAVGLQALRDNKACCNTAVGMHSLLLNTTGGLNTAVGWNALYSNTDRGANTAVGGQALQNHTSGGSNTAVGAWALTGGTDTYGNPILTGSHNTASGVAALYANTSGHRNTATGGYALYYNTSGYRNTATGVAAMQLNTSGHRNTATGTFALGGNASGYRNTAVGNAALAKAETANRNTAVGGVALFNNSSGSYNTAVGQGALFGQDTGPPDYTSITSSSHNTVAGWDSMRDNTTGNDNVAIGARALKANTEGGQNAVLGREALVSNSTGSENTGLGYRALYNSTGDGNIALGFKAGYDLGAGSNNIFIGQVGASGDAGTIRIGTSGTHSATYVAGITGTALAAATGHVVTDANGRLGFQSFVSSRRFKEEIRDVGAVSGRVLGLRPVSFLLKEDAAGGDRELQYGLIAEEVAEVFPELVTYDAEGRPHAVKYQFLSSLLLSEVQRQNRVIEGQRDDLADLQGLKLRLARLEEEAFRETASVPRE